MLLPVLLLAPGIEGIEGIEGMALPVLPLAPVIAEVMPLALLTAHEARMSVAC